MTKIKTLQKIDVFISSPGDVQKERQIVKRVINRLNRMQHIASRYILKPLAYEGEVPAAIGKHPQMIVDHYMMQADKSDLFICILWHRMGTPVTHEETGEQFQSGTEYEFVSAYRANQHHGKPHILLYRSTKPIPHDSDLEQVIQVQAFFKRFEGDKPEYKGLYKTYRTDSLFEEMLFHDLDAVLSKGLIKPDVDDEAASTSILDHVTEATTTSFGLEHRDRELRLKAMLADHSGFMNNRLESFVGRQKELAELRLRIAEKMLTGGYVTITGQAGQGKSSIIAKLVEDYGPGNVAFHFIPLNPGPDHQINLLRNLMARLILKYDLSVLYVASESRAALRDYFPRVLEEVVARDGQEMIFVDGLDQLEEEFTGQRDLSFLPNDPPVGIVFVLGTRPNDTLRPLELLKPRHEYKLPDLSRQNFDLILKHRGVHLQLGLADQFYQVMQANALYLDLVAKELRENRSYNPSEIITRIADNPEKLFTLAMDRLGRSRRDDTLWNNLIKPLLGVLLAAREPFTKQSIKQILGIDTDRVNEGIWRLGGLLTDDGQKRYSLFHLKLRDYLLSDEIRPSKDYIFDRDEEKHWHKKLADWCARGELNIIWQDINHDLAEQERRRYARHHYIVHLYQAKVWQQLFNVLDAAHYGKAKVNYDPSTRLYVQDLDLGRQAAAWDEWTIMEGLALLPHLWRYTLLRCSLASHADQYPMTAFQLLVVLGRKSKALGLAELLTDPAHKVAVLIQIARQMAEQQEQEAECIEILMRAYEVAQIITDSYLRAEALGKLGHALEQVQQWEQAERIIRSIVRNDIRVEALHELGRALARAQQWEQAERTIRSIPDSYVRVRALGELDYMRAEALRELGRTLTRAQQWEQAEKTICSIADNYVRISALCELGRTLAQAQRWEHAKRVTNLVQGGYEHTKTLCELGRLLAQAQLWWQAETVICSIADNYMRAEALRELGRTLAQARRWEQAEKTIRSIPDNYVQIIALCELGLMLAQAHHWEQAELIWKRVEAMISSVSDSFVQVRALYGFERALIQVRQWEQVENFFRRIEAVIDMIVHGYVRAQALRDLGSTLAQVQLWERAIAYWKRAEETIKSAIPRIDTRVKALCELGQALVEAQQWKLADKIWEQTEAVINSIPESCVQELGQALTQAQQWERAERVIRSIAHRDMRAEALRKLGQALTQAQQWERAEKVIWLIPKKDSQTRALEELASALAQAECWKQAERVIFSIVDDDLQTRALHELGKILVQAQRWKQAERVVSAIPNSYIRTEVLCELGIVLVQIKQWEQAETFWKRAERMIRSIVDDDARSEALRKLGRNLVQVQQWDRAERVIRSIPDSQERARALGALGSALVQAQQGEQAEAIWKQAEEVIHFISDENIRLNALHELRDKRASALLDLVRTLAEAEQWEQAEKVINSIANSLTRSEALRELGRNLVQAQQWERAERVIRLIPNSQDQAGALGELGSALMHTQQREQAEVIWEQAERVISSIASSLTRSEPIRELGRALVQAEHWEQAERIIRFIGDGGARSKSLGELGRALVQAEHWEQAERVILSILDSQEQARALEELGSALAEAQQWEWAERVAAAIKNSQERARTLGELGSALVQAQQGEQAEAIWKQAEEIVRFIPDENIRLNALRQLAHKQAGALRELVRNLAEAKQWEQAERVTHSIHDSYEHACALRDLGHSLMQMQQWARAERVILSIPYSQDRAGAWGDLGIALVQAQQGEQAEAIWKQAEEIVISIDEEAQQEALWELGSALVQVQYWNQAQRVIHLILDDDIRLEALRELGSALVGAQQWKWAEAIWEQARTVIDLIASSYEQAKVLQELVSTLMQAQHLERAEVMWKRVEELICSISESDSEERTRILGKLGSVLAQAQQWEQAERVILSIGDEDTKSEALWELGNALMQAQQWEQAERVILSIPDSDLQAMALGELASELAATDEHVQLLKLVQRTWQQAENRDYAIKFLPLANDLIFIKPEISITLCEAFNWVDAFLKNEV